MRTLPPNSRLYARVQEMSSHGETPEATNRSTPSPGEKASDAGQADEIAALDMRPSQPAIPSSVAMATTAPHPPAPPRRSAQVEPGPVPSQPVEAPRPTPRRPRPAAAAPVPARSGQAEAARLHRHRSSARSIPRLSSSQQALRPSLPSRSSLSLSGTQVTAHSAPALPVQRPAPATAQPEQPRPERTQVTAHSAPALPAQRPAPVAAAAGAAGLEMAAHSAPMVPVQRPASVQRSLSPEEISVAGAAEASAADQSHPLSPAGPVVPPRVEPDGASASAERGVTGPAEALHVRSAAQPTGEPRGTVGRDASMAQAKARPGSQPSALGPAPEPKAARRALSMGISQWKRRRGLQRTR